MTEPTSIYMRPPLASAPAALPRAQISALNKAAYVFLCLFLFLMFGRLMDFVMPRLHLPLIASVTALALMVVSGGLLQLFSSSIGLQVTLLSIWFAVTVPFSTYRGGSFVTVTSDWMRAYLCFLLVLCICRQPHQIRFILRLLAWTLLMTALLAIYFGATLHERMILPVGLLAGPNELGGAMLVGILYWLFLIFDSTVFAVYRLFGLAAMMPMLYVLLKTGSRASMITLVVAFSILFLYLSPGRKLLVACMGGVTLLLAFTVLQDGLRNRFTTFYASSDREREVEALDSPIGSSEHRFYLLKRSIAFTLTHPVFGVGPGQFAPREDAASRSEGQSKGSWLGTHNTYTQISSESGIPGLLIFIAILITSLRSTIWTHKAALRLGGEQGSTIANTAMALRIVLIAYVVFFAFEHTAYMPFWPTAVGLIAALELSVRSLLPATPVIPPRAARIKSPIKSALPSLRRG